MGVRQNQQFGRGARILLILVLIVGVAVIALSIHMLSDRPAVPARGATPLPGQESDGSTRTLLPAR